MAMTIPTAFRHFWLATCTQLVIGACLEDPPPRAGSVAAAALRQDTLAPFAGTMGPVLRLRAGPPGSPVPRLRAARATRETGFDRLVFEFSSDSVPGYEVAYAGGPPVRCGSGDAVSLAGAGFLVVRFEPAQAHDEEGRSTVAVRKWAPELRVVKELELVCDFEGQVEWGVGLATSRRFRVLESAAPARVIVDVRHHD